MSRGSSMSQQMDLTSSKSEYFSIDGDNANSVYLVTPKGEECDVVVSFERKSSNPAVVPLLIREPVRVTKGDDGREELRYNSSVMQMGKIYQVMWNGKPYGLRKTESEVEILRFYPDDHEQGD